MVLRVMQKIVVPNFKNLHYQWSPVVEFRNSVDLYGIIIVFVPEIHGVFGI